MHGDDYASTGEEQRQLQWLKRELEQKFEIKTTMIAVITAINGTDHFKLAINES